MPPRALAMQLNPPWEYADFIERQRQFVTYNTASLIALVACYCVLPWAGAAKPERLPRTLLKALDGHEADFCDQYLGSFRNGCRQKFRSNLLWHHLVLTPAGDNSIVLENRNIGACGSAGCAIYVFLRQPTGAYLQVLGTQGEVGALERIGVLPTLTKGHYDIQKTWADGETKSVYRWNGLRYTEH